MTVMKSVSHGFDSCSGHLIFSNICSVIFLYRETHATIATRENFKVFRDTFLTLLQRGLRSYTCNSSSPLVKVSKKCQKSVMKDFKIFHGGNSSVRLTLRHIRVSLSYDETVCL